MQTDAEKFERFRKWIEHQINEKEKLVDATKAELNTLYDIRAASLNFAKE